VNGEINMMMMGCGSESEGGNTAYDTLAQLAQE